MHYQLANAGGIYTAGVQQKVYVHRKNVFQTSPLRREGAADPVALHVPAVTAGFIGAAEHVSNSQICAAPHSTSYMRGE
jgi:hypothetical protein